MRKKSQRHRTLLTVKANNIPLIYFGNWRVCCLLMISNDIFPLKPSVRARKCRKYDCACYALFTQGRSYVLCRQMKKRQTSALRRLQEEPRSHLIVHVHNPANMAEVTQTRLLPLPQASHAMVGHTVGAGSTTILVCLLTVFAWVWDKWEGSIAGKRAIASSSSTPLSKITLASTVKSCLSCFWFVPGST